jgi:hypothetical protein
LKIHITRPYKNNNNNLGGLWKATQDISEAITQIGGHEIGLYQYQSDETFEQLQPRMDGIIAGIERGDVLIIQYAEWLNSRTFHEALLTKAKAYGATVIMWIHDVDCYLTGQELATTRVDYFNRFDAIVAHTEPMKKMLIRDGVTTKIVTLGIFDYLTEAKYVEPTFSKEITLVTGSPNKSGFVNKWNSKYQLNVYAPNRAVPYEFENRKNVVYKGQVASNLIPFEIHSGFGIVWFENEEQTIKAWLPNGKPAVILGDLGEDYSKINAAHKISSYFAAGIPLIVKSNLAQAEMIKKNDLGLIVDSIEDIDDVLSKVTAEDYSRMTSSVHSIHDLVTNGFFTIRAVDRALQALMVEGGEF